MIVTLATPGLSATSAADGSRTVSQVYQGAAGVSGSLSGASPVVLTPGPPVQLQSRENRLTLAVADQSSQRVMVQIQYVAAGQRAVSSLTSCDPQIGLTVAAGSQVRATPLVGRCADGTLSAPTSGSLTFRFFAPRIVRTVPPSQRWAALVGITAYQGTTHDTVGGAADAAAVRSALLHSGWRSDHILMVTDQAGTVSGVEGAMRWLVAHSTPDTFSLFHYSGHVCIASRGPCGSGHTYLWTTDNRFIPETTVAADLRGLRGHAWLDFAGCEAGAFDAGLHSPDRLFTASSRASETSYEEPKWGQSVWSGFLWDRGYARGQASGGRPYAASIDALTSFATSQSTAYTANQPAGAQHPYVAGGTRGWTLTAPPG